MEEKTLLLLTQTAQLFILWPPFIADINLNVYIYKTDSSHTFSIGPGEAEGERPVSKALP